MNRYGSYIYIYCSYNVFIIVTCMVAGAIDVTVMIKRVAVVSM
jgi:hypothetical protein